MTKQEFEEKVNGTVSDSEYKIIEMVYTWHPVISDTNGKNEIAAIWTIGGMPLIKGMVEAAEMTMKLDKEERKIKAQLEKIQNRKRRVAMGDTEYERCYGEMESAIEAADTVNQFERFVKVLGEKYSGIMVMEIRNELNV